MADALTARIPRRSMGLKLLLVCALALLMSIPALLVFALLMDRTSRAERVSQEVGGLMGGEQSFLGPVLAVPYTFATGNKEQPVGRGVFVVFPVTGKATVASKSEVRQRSLFKVPVYQADLAFKGTFDLTGIAARTPEGASLDWSRAEFLVGASDARGAQADIVMTAAGQALPMAPATTLADAPVQTDTTAATASYGRRPMADMGLRLFGAPAAGIAGPEARFDVAANMKFSGAERLSVLAFAKATEVEARGDWPDPSFDGGFLPVRKEITDHGFTAAWRVPFIARGVPAQVTSDGLGRLGATQLGVSFVDPANPYQSVARSLKYALMFVGLVFLAYFLFETMQNKRVHAAQYVLIGLSQMVFYLLLLSIAERVGFDLGFLIAAGATVALISAYAGWAFESRRQGLIALAAFSLLYALIYVLMRLEDWALLVGALTSFAAIAAVMYFTRRIDWYGAAAAEPAAAKEAS